MAGFNCILIVVGHYRWYVRVSSCLRRFESQTALILGQRIKGNLLEMKINKAVQTGTFLKMRRDKSLATSLQPTLVRQNGHMRYHSVP